MNYLALAAALFLSSAVSAQTFGAALNLQAQAALKQVDTSALAANFKTGYSQEINAVMNGLHCAPLNGGWNCEGIEPAAIEKAGNALTAISNRVTAEGKVKGDSIALKMEPEILALTARINASKAAAADKQRMLGLVAGLRNNIKMLGTKETPEAAQAIFDNFNAQVTDMLSMAQNGQTALVSYNEKYAAWTAKIGKANLSLQNKNYYSAMTSMAVGSGVMANCGVGAPPCLNVPKAEAALTQFEALAASMDATVKRMGAQTFVAYYGPKLADLTAKIERAPIDAATKAALRLPVGGLLARYADTHIAFSPENAETAYQKTADDAAAGLDKAIDGAKVTADLPKTVAVIKAEIANPKLSAQAKSNFTAQLAIILTQAHCSPDGGQCDRPRTPFEAPMFATSHQVAVAQLAQLDSAIDKATQDASGPTLAAVYMPKLVKLQNKVATSKVDGVDKTRLMNFIGGFERSLNGLAGPKPTPEAAEAIYQKMSDDVDAAIDMANSKK